jgi:SAM-dependent methyltransferase
MGKGIDPSIRGLSDSDARRLKPGADHYVAFVGPPAQYDLMGATQFMLLVTLGLRDSHRVLDFGCGSLRAGRLLIPYLQPGHYFGLEPNSWLIDDAIDRQIGRDQVTLKQPRFFAFDDFRAERCGGDFDFILAQSIFSHAGADIVQRSLDGFGQALAPSGLAVATFILPGQAGVTESHEPGWLYPDCVAHAPATIATMIARAKLYGRMLPWFHPRQTWYALARDPARLPAPAFDQCLRGAVLNVPDWRDSL